MTDKSVETTTDATPMVSVRGVHKFFGDLHVLRGIDLDIAPGEVCVILGPSGSGKSTLLRCLNLLEEISAGRVYVDGELLGYREYAGGAPGGRDLDGDAEGVDFCDVGFGGLDDAETPVGGEFDEPDGGEAQQPIADGAAGYAEFGGELVAAVGGAGHHGSGAEGGADVFDHPVGECGHGLGLP